MNEFIAKANMAVEKTKADIVTQTLDKLDSPNYSGKSKKNKFGSAQQGMKATYELSKAVLSAAYEGKGIGINTKG